MTETPITGDLGVFDAIRAQEENSVRRLPVVDGEGNVAGVVALDDLVGLLSDELATVTGVIEAESPPY